MTPTIPMILSGLVVLVAAVVFGVIAIRRWRSQGRSIIECLGLRWDRSSATDLLIGLAITTFVMLSIFACELASGSISREPVTVATAMSSWKSTLIMLFAAPEEEIINRSILLSGLAIALGGRGKTAVLITSVIFGLAHFTNPGGSVVSALGNALGGLIYGYAFVMSGRLWLPIGLHLAWNLVQGPVLGFPVSGLAAGGLQHIYDLGPAWLTGGTYGPEAGAVGIAFRFVVIALVFVYVTFSSNKDSRREFAERVAAVPVRNAEPA
jgi:membrane protease YdiL (CAAX protease family)